MIQVISFVPLQGYFCQRMKQVLSFILLFIFSAQTFSQGLMVAGFYVNREYIAKNLCINRSRPKMHCNGRCQLMKKFRQQEKQDQGTPSGKLSLKYQVLLNKTSFPVTGHKMITTGIEHAEMNAASLADRSYPLLHPPD